MAEALTSTDYQLTPPYQSGATMEELSYYTWQQGLVLSALLVDITNLVADTEQRLANLETRISVLEP